MLEHDLTNIVKESTCYKNRDNPKCIDLILTNKPRSFQHTTTFDTGVSDYHKMVLTSFKCKFDKRTPKEVVYRDYKNFESGIFREELKDAIYDANDWCILESRFLNILDKHAPIKKKTIRANHAPYMTKGLKSAIMKRTQLANKYHKTRSDIDYKSFKKQKNYVDRLYKREKKSFINNLSMGELADNKKFWNTFKQLFSDESKGNHKMTLMKGKEILSNPEKVANQFGCKFINAVKKFNIPDNPHYRSL